MVLKYRYELLVNIYLYKTLAWKNNLQNSLLMLAIQKKRWVWSKRVIWKLKHFQSLPNSSKIAQQFLLSYLYSSYDCLNDKGRSYNLIRNGIKRKFKEIEEDIKDKMNKDLNNYKNERLNLRKKSFTKISILMTSINSKWWIR